MIGYEYGNTRLRAMKSRLLTRIELVALNTSGSLDRMLAALADTQYGPDVEASLIRARGLRRVDETIRSNLARTLKQMASFYDDDARRRVNLLLHRWDLSNLRALIRLPRGHLEPRDVADLLVPAGVLSESELVEIGAQADLRSRIDLIVAWGVPSATSVLPLIRARADYELHGDLSALEAALEAAFLGELGEVMGDERTGAAGILRAEIETRNLTGALRRRAARLEREPGWEGPDQLYVDAGLIPVAVWEQVSETDTAQAVAELLSTRRLPAGWHTAVNEWASHGDLALLSTQMRSAVTRAAVTRLVSGDVLGFDVPLAFTFAKEAETRDLHLIARGIVHDIPPDDIESRLEAA